MVTLVFVSVKDKDEELKILAKGFEFKYLKVENTGQLPSDGKQVIFFHPRVKDMNPPWLPEDRVENFKDFDFPSDAYYIFADDYGDITSDVEFNAPNLTINSRWVKIPTKKEFKSLHTHIAAGIVLWEYFKRKGDLTLL